MTIDELNIYQQCYNSDCRDFFTINSRYTGYLSRDHQTYFVLDKEANAYKDYTRAEMQAFLNSLGSPETVDIIFTQPVKQATNFLSKITQSDNGKLTTGLMLLGALAIGVYIINKKS